MALHPKKRLIICCDGTWQVSDRAPSTEPSNIVKLSRMIHRESEGLQPFPQVVYYQSGVGTSNWGAFKHLPSVLAMLSASFGDGLEDNVLTAYHYLSTNYYHPSYDEEHGHCYRADEVFLFGFSRGAFTARALAGLVTELGLFRPQYMNEFRRAYGLYRHLGIMAAERGLMNIRFVDRVKALQGFLSEEDYNFLLDLHDHSKHSVDYYAEEAEKKAGGFGREEREKKRKEVLAGKKLYEGVTIKVVGVWDTVGALGIPDSLVSWMFPSINNQYKFHDAALNSKIENAFQALALDEHRGAFKPTLWYLDEKFLDGGKCPNLKQCWFPGFHESIGGGDTAAEHWMKKYLPATSEMHDVTLAWMCDQVDGLPRFDHDACKKILLSADRDRVNWASAFETDLGFILFAFSFSIMGGIRRRTPGRYNIHNSQWKVRTNETMHPSVYYRIETTARRFFPYFPPALKEHVVSWLPEWYMEPRAPRWRWEESKDGHGAQWIRPSVPKLWPHTSAEELKIPEWVIREDLGRFNFEATLLPPKFKKRLRKRNDQKIVEAETAHTNRAEAVEEHANKGGETTHTWKDHVEEKQQFWTRTTWDGNAHAQYGKIVKKGNKPCPPEDKPVGEANPPKKQKVENNWGRKEHGKTNGSHMQDPSMNGGAVQPHHISTWNFLYDVGMKMRLMPLDCGRGLLCRPVSEAIC